MRRFIQSAIIGAMLLGAVFYATRKSIYYTSVIVPRAALYREALRGLKITDVTDVHLSELSETAGHVRLAEKRHLTDLEVATLIPLVNQAHKWVPDYPGGGVRYILEIGTTNPIGPFKLEVHSSENNGVLLNLFSDGLTGWNYGTLRNDALRPFLEGLASKRVKAVPVPVDAR